MPPSTVRPAEPNDADALAALVAQLGYPVPGGDLARRLAAVRAEPKAEALVAMRGGRVVGAATLAFADVLHEPGPWCRITALVVAEGERGQHAGRALVAAAEEAARAAGCVRIEATSARERAGSHDFYERLGYRSLSRHFVKRLEDDGSP